MLLCVYINIYTHHIHTYSHDFITSLSAEPTPLCPPSQQLSYAAIGNFPCPFQFHISH